MSEWQPIETAPKDEGFIAYDAYSGVMQFVKFVNGHIVSTWDHDYFEEATHWMTKPQPPKD